MNRIEARAEIQETGNSDRLCCDKCGKWFANPNILNIHEQMHSIGKYSTSGGDMTITGREILYQEVRKQQQDVPDRKNSIVNIKPRRIYKPPSKRVGLTKIRMEDCLRCDACSCIYIDERDYYKHMRNFHEKYNTIIPRSVVSCCEFGGPAVISGGVEVTTQIITGVTSIPPLVMTNSRNRFGLLNSQQDTADLDLGTPDDRKNNPRFKRTRRKSPTSLRNFTKSSQDSQISKIDNEKSVAQHSTNINGENICENIKVRWSKVLSRRLSDLPRVKTEVKDPLDVDSFLKVEVQIKAEPPEEDLSSV